jgi:transposase
MSYLGLTPSEYSSGARRRRGGITKAGNTHARGKHANQVVVAIAREMAAFAWAIARTVPRTS